MICVLIKIFPRVVLLFIACNNSNSFLSTKSQQTFLDLHMNTLLQMLWLMWNIEGNVNNIESHGTHVIA